MLSGSTKVFLRFGHLLLLKGPGAVVEKSHRPSCGRPSPWRCVTRACNLQDAKKPGSAWLGGTIRLTLPCLPQPAGREFPRERIAEIPYSLTDLQLVGFVAPLLVELDMLGFYLEQKLDVLLAQLQRLLQLFPV